MPGLKRKFKCVKSSSSDKKKKLSSALSKRVNAHTGKASENATTLSRCIGPFSKKKMVSFEYDNSLTKYTSGVVATAALPVLANSLYAFDQTSGSTFGNKQPLYYDTLVTATGPYRQYKVLSWVTTYTVLNSMSVPLNVWCLPPVSSTTELDTVSEVENFPGVKKMCLTAKGGAKDIGSVTMVGNISDVYPSSNADYSLVGPYNGSPSNPAYQGLYLQSADGSTLIDFYVRVHHVAYVELSLTDGYLS